MASNHNTLTSSRVAIIGAGVSGLAAAKHLARHNPTVFEASDWVGGVWRSCTYGTTKLQSARVSYEFSDFPWPDRNDTAFPSYIEILDYLESYAKHFDLFKFIKFGSKVIEVRFTGEGETSQMDDLGAYGNLLPGKPVWEIAVRTRDGDAGDIQWHAFEFVVVCTGKYGDVPRIPTFPAKKRPEIFKGRVMHSMDYCKLEKDEASNLLRGKKVAVVGFKKSAIDLALESALANQGEGGQACTMVVRTPHWVIPHYWIWGLPFFLFYSTRAAQFLHDKPNRSFLRPSLSHLPLEKYGLKPDHPFEEDYASWIEFEDGTTLEADVVILATGYDGDKKLKAIIPEPFRSWLEFPWGLMPLYSIQHADDLCNDMGLNPRRKSNLFLDVFCPYGSQDYRFDEEKTN
ncbi:hypothetical protein Bca4012_055818 [Brassica carinata]